MFLKPIPLPAPRRDGGKTVTRALQLRKTTREISSKNLSLKVLSDLLWAASGVNRTRGPFGIPGRTAATASNSQEIDLYVVLPEATYLYDPLRHILEPVYAGDLRPYTINPGQADMVASTPVNLIFVADVYRLSHTSGYQEPGLLDPGIRKSYYFADTGLIAGNVYLFAASRGLAAWFHNCNKRVLKARLKLKSEQRVLFGQTIGYHQHE